MEGLTEQDIEYRINNNLVNNEDIKNSRTMKQIIWSNLLTLFNLIHVVLLVLVLTTGSLKNAMFMGAICVNIFISIYQEIKAKRIIDKLKISTVSKVNVIREGLKQEILPTEIVLDDLLYVTAGDSLVVDAVIEGADNLEVDESIITGESDSILKKKGDKLISGSIITSGSGYAKVTSINRDTYANTLIKEASKNKDDSSYLMHSINNILKVVTILIIPVGVSLFITQFSSGSTYSEAVLSGVAGVIGMIPDGLVLLTSISLTVGVIKMASKKVIIQRLSGIELLACTDILCLDKTGTITDGSMAVVDLINLDRKYNLENIISGMITNKEGNATDKAIIKAFGTESTLKEVERVPFSSARKYAMVTFKEGTYAIGALEYMTNKKTSDFPELDAPLSKGYRIISLIDVNGEFNLKTNKVIGFIALKDNIRSNAKETLEYFKKQDVLVKIISGDNPITVSNLLKQISIPEYDKYISGTDLPEDYKELKKIVSNYTIFGRVTPYQKQQIVKALKENNNMVGYIGDGVNDILALKESDCGIALASGISAARSVAEVVLTNADFGILPSIVNEGRRVVNNIERVASMYLIKTVYSFLIALTCVIIGHEYPFYPIQLSLISSVCVGLPSFFLAIEPNYTKVEKGFMLKVFRNALPSALCVWINILFLIMINDIFHLDFDIFRFTVVAVTGYINLRLLHNISKPLTKMRKILLYFCFITFYLLLIIFNKFFQANTFHVLTFVFIVIIIAGDIYIIDFFESLYDKFARFYKRRRRVKSEKE